MNNEISSSRHFGSKQFHLHISLFKRKEEPSRMRTRQTSLCLRFGCFFASSPKCVICEQWYECCRLFLGAVRDAPRVRFVALRRRKRGSFVWIAAISEMATSILVRSAGRALLNASTHENAGAINCRVPRNVLAALAGMCHAKNPSECVRVRWWFALNIPTYGSARAKFLRKFRNCAHVRRCDCEMAHTCWLTAPNYIAIARNAFHTWLQFHPGQNERTLSLFPLCLCALGHSTWFVVALRDFAWRNGGTHTMWQCSCFVCSMCTMRSSCHSIHHWEMSRRKVRRSNWNFKFRPTNEQCSKTSSDEEIKSNKPSCNRV